MEMCARCKKRPATVYIMKLENNVQKQENVSHSNRKSSRTWAPNVQKVRVLVEGRPMRLNVCTRCLRSGYVQRALPTVQNEVTEEA